MSNKENFTPFGTRRVLTHLQALMTSLGQLSRSPWATLITFAVIGIALSLPMGFSVVLKNVQVVSGSLHDTGQISLYLKSNLDSDTLNQDLNVLRADQGVAGVKYITPEDGLAEFSKQSGYTNILKGLPNNPIPGVIVVQPSPAFKFDWQVQQLYQRIKQLPGVSNAQLDMQWLQRLKAIVAMGHRATTLLLILFAVAVLLLIGNTIRLTTQHYREEIEIIKLLGGTNSFIRRPFLYSGAIYGFSGGIVAWFIVDIALHFLQNPISELSSLYGSQYETVGLGMHSTLLLLIGGTFLGVLAAYLAANRYIRQISFK
jgi:cell division transport system permease protein